MTTRKLRLLAGTMLICLGLLLSARSAEACTRAVYHDDLDRSVILTGRNMDWYEDMESNIWFFPANTTRIVPLPPQLAIAPLTWPILHASVITTAYDMGTVDGMNDAGLVANILYLQEADYGPLVFQGRNLMPVSAWAQWVLDNYETVDEAIAGLEERNFLILSVEDKQGQPPTKLHMSISDKFGGSAIVEYVNGELKIHKYNRDDDSIGETGSDRDTDPNLYDIHRYQVMTNSPPMDEYFEKTSETDTTPIHRDGMITRFNNWKDEQPKDGGDVSLPGTLDSFDRFTRATFYINQVTPPIDKFESAYWRKERDYAATVLSVMRNVSVPIGVSDPHHPENPGGHSTIWRTVADQKNGLYYFENTRSLSLVWIDLKKMNGRGPKKLPIAEYPYISGDQTYNFSNAQDFFDETDMSFGDWLCEIFPWFCQW